MKMLVVDDDIVNCQLLQQIVKPYGDVEIAMDGEEAFITFESAHQKNAPFNIIFMDIMMPKMDGHGLLKKIRDWESKNVAYGSNEVKVVMVSAFDSKEHVLSSFKEGCEYYLVKPITRAKINEIMTEMGY